MIIVPWVLLFFLVVPAWSQERGWNETLEAGKKEGNVVVLGPPEPGIRNDLIPKFTSRFGIPVEFLAGRGAEGAARVRTERQAGIYAIDVFLSTISVMSHILYPEKMLDPLKPMFTLPEVVDPAKWKMGKPWFVDPEEKYVLRVFRHVTSWLYINTEYVRPEEIRSARDLLNPKWRGKIATDDPEAKTGAGTSVADYFYLLFGPEFVKKLYFEQKPIRSRDKRQLTDWLARGTYPICFACDGGMVKGFQREGFKLLEVFELSDVPGRLSSSGWLLAVANRAPHPNAARVFANWVVSKEALETYTRGDPSATLRSDVDESFLDPRTIPRPGVKYIWDEEWDFVLRRRPETRERVLKLLKSG